METPAKTMLALAILFAAVRSPGYAEVPWRGLAGAAAGTCSANPREREHMDAGQFRKRLSTLTGFPRERAELLARTTLVTLSSRISAGEADDLAAQLPDPFKACLPHNSKPCRFDPEEFERRVARIVPLANDQARPAIRAVFTVLAEAVTEGELSEVLGQLGTEYERLVGLPAGKHAA